MSDEELTAEDLALIEDVFLKVFPIRVERYETNHLEMVTKDVVTTLKAGVISLRTGNMP